MSTSETFAVGDHVVFKGLGLARIEKVERSDGVESLVLDVETQGMHVFVPVANAPRAIRPLVNRATAAALWAELKRTTEPNLRPRSDRSFDDQRTLRKGTIQEQVTRLQLIYSSPFVQSFGERRTMSSYEQMLFEEIGHVLGMSVDDMRDEMRAIQPTFSKDVTERPPEPPEPQRPPEGPAVRGYDLLGRFHVERRLVVADVFKISSHVGEDEGPCCLLDARPGDWYGYTMDFAREEGLVRFLLAVHASQLPREVGPLDKKVLAALQKRSKVVTRVRVGAQVVILDAAVRDEERFDDELSFRTVYGNVLDRGCTCSTGGGGVLPVSAILADGVAVFVQVDFK